VKLTRPSSAVNFSAACVLLATGRRPIPAGINLEAAGAEATGSRDADQPPACRLIYAVVNADRSHQPHAGRYEQAFADYGLRQQASPGGSY